MKNCQQEKWVAAEKAAHEMGTTVMNVLMHIRDGLLRGREVDGLWQVTAESLADQLRRSPEEKGSSLCRSGCASKNGGCGACG
jgi:hypothetical protein